MTYARSAALRDEAVIWHDVECGGYRADLPLWHELAAERAGPIVELGSGTGRVSLELAASGHAITAVDSDPALLRALAARARERGLAVRTCAADVRALELGASFALALAPMQVVQLLGGASGRGSMLGAVRRHLRPGGLLAAALADPLEGTAPEIALPPLPDVRESAGWVFSSTPVAVRGIEAGVMIDRYRQVVSPTGDLSESLATVELARVSADELARAAESRGYRALAPCRLPATADYVGSTVVMLEAA